jgi:hypothetical protein
MNKKYTLKVDAYEVGLLEATISLYIDVKPELKRYFRSIRTQLIKIEEENKK